MIDIDQFISFMPIDKSFYDQPYIVPNDNVGVGAFAAIRKAMASKSMFCAGPRGDSTPEQPASRLGASARHDKCNSPSCRYDEFVFRQEASSIVSFARELGRRQSANGSAVCQQHTAVPAEQVQSNIVETNHYNSHKTVFTAGSDRPRSYSLDKYSIMRKDATVGTFVRNNRGF